jgi:hypothetical protein
MGARLKPEDWKSGDRPWLFELVVLEGPDRDKANAAMLADVAKTIFEGSRFKFHAINPAAGKREVREVGA